MSKTGYCRQGSLPGTDLAVETRLTLTPRDLPLSAPGVTEVNVFHHAQPTTGFPVAGLDGSQAGLFSQHWKDQLFKVRLSHLQLSGKLG